MSKSFREDLTGQRFGRLTVIEFVPTEGYRTYWKCKCDCGKETIVEAYKLKIGHTKSCGCWQKDFPKETKRTHGQTKSRLHRVWGDMKSRCNNPKFPSFKDYGGRGITVCDEWKNDFNAFQKWAISHGYDDTLTIDRIDNDKGYFPENCRWVDAKTQCRNTRRNFIVEYQGKMITLAEAAEQSGLHRATLKSRWIVGDRSERLFRPARKK